MFPLLKVPINLNKIIFIIIGIINKTNKINNHSSLVFLQAKNNLKDILIDLILIIQIKFYGFKIMFYC
jgi:hypothetical protein